MSINEAINIQTTSINAITPTTGVLSVGYSQTIGVLNLGTGVRTAAGIVNIATGASNACAINIMNGATTAGSVNIANGTGASQTTAVNIGSGSTTGTVTIGNSANTVQINGALTLGTGKNITLQPTTGIVAPTAFTQLGGTSTTESNITLTLGSGIVAIPIQITRAGTYLFTCGAQLTFTAAFTNFYSNIFESSAVQTVNTVATAGTGRGQLVTTGNFGQQLLGTVGGAQYMTTNGSYVYTVPQAKANFYYSFIMYVSGGGTLSTINTYMTITRLA